MMRLPQRFIDKIEPEPMSGCWLWHGAQVPKGYGSIWNGEKVVAAHRGVWALLVGIPIPAGMQIDHKCRTRCCVNPDHLRIVTAKENVHAPGSEATAARHARKVVCPKCGGPYSNFRCDKGRRRCVPCKNELQRKRFARTKLDIHIEEGL